MKTLLEDPPENRALGFSGVFSAWGEDLAFSQAVSDRYGFTQRERDTESSLMHFRARSYDPRIGRFGRKDPRNTYLDQYLYVNLQPLKFRDPTGEYWVVSDFPNSGMATVAVKDLEKYTGRRISFGEGNDVWFGEVWSKQYASDADMEWIWKVQNSAAPTSILGLWQHFVGGDDWHKEQFKRAWHAHSGLEYPIAAFFRGAGQTAGQMLSFGLYEADQDIQMFPGFKTYIWVGRIGAIVAKAGIAAKAGALGAIASGAKTGGGAVFKWIAAADKMKGFVHFVSKLKGATLAPGMANKVVGLTVSVQSGVHFKVIVDWSRSLGRHINFSVQPWFNVISHRCLVRHSPRRSCAYSEGASLTAGWGNRNGRSRDQVADVLIGSKG